MINFDEIFNEYKDIVFSKVYLTLGDFDIAEEVTQDIFVKIYFWLKKFENKSSIKTWIFSIVRNACIDFLRKKKEYDISLDDCKEIDISLIDECIINKIESSDQIENVFKTLTRIERLILLMKFEEWLTLYEISNILKKNPSTTKKIFYNARNTFISNYEKLYENKNI